MRPGRRRHRNERDTPAATYGPLYVLPAAAIAPTLEQLAPTIYGDALMVTRANWYLVTGAISEQLEARRGSRPGNQAQIAPGPDGRTIWVTGLGQFGNVSIEWCSRLHQFNWRRRRGRRCRPEPKPARRCRVSVSPTSPPRHRTRHHSPVRQSNSVCMAACGKASHFVEMQAGGLFSEGSGERPLSAYGGGGEGQHQRRGRR